MMTFRTLGLTAVMTLCAAAGSAQAQAQPPVLGNGDVINLAALMNSQTRQFCVGDKLFTFESYTSGQFNPASFSVIGFIAAPNPLTGLSNIGFDLTGPFGDGSPGSGVIHEMNLQYTVEIKPAFVNRLWISDAHLTFNGSATGPGSFSRVDESILDFTTNTLLTQLSVFDIAGNPNQTRLTDGVDWYNQVPSRCFTKLEINKDLKFFAGATSSTSTASFVRQEFSQIPAPGAAVLLGAGGLLALRRRR